MGLGHMLLWHLKKNFFFNFLHWRLLLDLAINGINTHAYIHCLVEQLAFPFANLVCSWTFQMKLCNDSSMIGHHSHLSSLITHHHWILLSSWLIVCVWGQFWVKPLLMFLAFNHGAWSCGDPPGSTNQQMCLMSPSDFSFFWIPSNVWNSSSFINQGLSTDWILKLFQSIYLFIFHYDFNFLLPKDSLVGWSFDWGLWLRYNLGYPEVLPFGFILVYIHSTVWWKALQSLKIK